MVIGGRHVLPQLAIGNRVVATAQISIREEKAISRLGSVSARRFLRGFPRGDY